MRTYKGAPLDSVAKALIVYLWERGTWVAGHELQQRKLWYAPKGTLGSAAEVRARELARNDCPDNLKDKVERARGSEIGLDRRFEYFRYRNAQRERTRAEWERVGRELCAWFDNYQTETNATV